MTTAINRLRKQAGHHGRFFLGLDTGPSRGRKNNCGYALVGTDGVVHDAGVWRLTRPSLLGRWAELRKVASIYIGQLAFIVAAGIEEPWIDPENPQVGLKLAKTWGILASLCWQRGFYVCGISPVTAKVALTKNSRASKEEVFTVAKMLWPDVKQFDEADAIAVATATRDMIVKKAMLEAADG